MSIRYKTAFIFLAAGLVPFLIVGTLVFIDFQNSLRTAAFRNLEAVTTLQETRVNDLLKGYSQSTTYLGQLQVVHQAVQDILASPDAAHKAKLTQLLTAIQFSGTGGGAPPVQDLAVTDPNGVVWSETPTPMPHQTMPVQANRLLTDIFRDKDGVHMLFGMPIVFDGKTRARIYMTLDAEPLIAITSTRDGLGQTGETFLDKRYNATTGIFVTPLRFDADAAFKRTVPLTDANRPSAQALLEKDQTYTSGVVSYRGQPVIAVTRYMPQAGLGIVGQIDQVEAFAPVHALAVQVVVFTALLVLLTLFIGSFMAELYTKPITHLAGVAAKLRKGDFSARASIRPGDELGQLGHSFNVMADDLAKQDQAKSDIIALISHQLRTPVTAVKGFVSLVLGEKHKRLTADDINMLRLAFAENEKLNKLITQILEVAHADSGKLAIKPAPTDMVHFMEQLAKEYQPMLRLRHQKLTLLPVHGPIMATIDPGRIRFVIDILLTNASKYSPENSEVELSLAQQGAVCRIEVADAGFGISSADQAKLFQKFSRIHNPRSDTSEGMGLGLYMAKKIVELHKGSISVSSSENRGSRFTIELPINNA